MKIIKKAKNWWNQRTGMEKGFIIGTPVVVGVGCLLLKGSNSGVVEKVDDIFENIVHTDRDLSMDLQRSLIDSCKTMDITDVYVKGSTPTALELGVTVDYGKLHEAIDKALIFADQYGIDNAKEAYLLLSL